MIVQILLHYYYFIINLLLLKFFNYDVLLVNSACNIKLIFELHVIEDK